MILYHGSFLEIAKPDLVHSHPNVDFGRGFYVTPLHEQAEKWCGKFKRRGKDGIISRYEYDESRKVELKILKFDSYSEEWLDFILNCRSGKDSTNYDLVVGGVANDKVFNTVELFFDGLIDAIVLLSNSQVKFSTGAFDGVTSQSTITVSPVLSLTYCWVKLSLCKSGLTSTIRVALVECPDTIIVALPTPIAKIFPFSST